MAIEKISTNIEQIMPDKVIHTTPESGKIEKKEQESDYIERDLSWLSFNYRVLQEAKDHHVPLLERVKFLAIYSSNLDEFFRVRVAQHHNLANLSKKTKKNLDYEPKKVLKQILKTVNDQQEEYSQILENQIIPELKQHNIYLRRPKELTAVQKQFVENYFQDHMLPFVQPVLLVKNKIRPFLNNGAIYLAVRLQPKHKINSPEEYAILKIPSDHLPRFIELPSTNEGEHELIFLDDIVRQTCAWIFPGYNIIEAYSIKLTRDAELYIEDEYSGNLVQKIKKSLSKRNVGFASRFVYDRMMPAKFLDVLKNVFDFEKLDALPEGRYHNNFDFFKFPDFGLKALKDQPLPAQLYLPLEKAANIFNAIRQRDHLLHYPYQSYQSVVQFFEAAAEDPDVTEIYVVQYRVAKKSRIMNALIDAAQQGKKVSVFIEVKARFDEEANLQWGEILQQAGVEVHYSMPGIKVHAKLACVTRKEGRKKVNYCYLSTGNFNEDTAKIYSDFGFFTADKSITEEVSYVLNYLATGNKATTPQFKHLLVGQFNLRDQLTAYIDQEITNAQQGKVARIFLKMNSLQDEMMMQKLYEASQKGVEIQLIIRGICCLDPNSKRSHKRIQAISIVDRFLEHGRVFIFHNGGNELVYLSSADWMERNLSFRVETAFPIYNFRLKEKIKYLMQLQWRDNTKSRWLDMNGANHYRKETLGISIRSQVETYNYLLQKPD